MNDLLTVTLYISICWLYMTFQVTVMMSLKSNVSEITITGQTDSIENKNQWKLRVYGCALVYNKLYVG